MLDEMSSVAYFRGPDALDWGNVGVPRTGRRLRFTQAQQKHQPSHGA